MWDADKWASEYEKAIAAAKPAREVLQECKRFRKHNEQLGEFPWFIPVSHQDLVEVVGSPFLWYRLLVSGFETPNIMPIRHMLRGWVKQSVKNTRILEIFRAAVYQMSDSEYLSTSARS